jgi:hypothetical protein
MTTLREFREQFEELVVQKATAVSKAPEREPGQYVRVDDVRDLLEESGEPPLSETWIVQVAFEDHVGQWANWMDRDYEDTETDGLAALREWRGIWSHKTDRRFRLVKRTHVLVEG